MSVVGEWDYGKWCHTSWEMQGTILGRKMVKVL